MRRQAERKKEEDEANKKKQEEEEAERKAIQERQDLVDPLYLEHDAYQMFSHLMHKFAVMYDVHAQGSFHCSSAGPGQLNEGERGQEGLFV